MSCKCNEIGDYANCYQHGDSSKWAEDQLARASAEKQGLRTTGDGVKEITDRLDEHDCDARSWMGTVKPQDIRNLLFIISTLKARIIELQSMDTKDAQENAALKDEIAR